ncbi:MAG TPA: hypothetical protein VK438_11005, partial [Xanthobacteraceae bacterium]|nr:hypothetical protein [Xanthobacteraceae bacterium]
ILAALKSLAPGEMRTPDPQTRSLDVLKRRDLDRFVPRRLNQPADLNQIDRNVDASRLREVA